jgi:hypothetical protein
MQLAPVCFEQSPRKSLWAIVPEFFIAVMEERLQQLEEQARRFAQEVAAARAHFAAEQELEHLKEENSRLRQAVIRYAVACAQVDLQVAIVRARGGDGPASDESLKSLMAEEAESSRLLRHIAKELQQPEQ